MAFSFQGCDLLGLDDLAFFTGDGVNQDITFTVDNLIPIRDAITGPITLTWKVIGPDTYVSVNLSYIYGDTIPVDFNGLNIGTIAVLRDGNPMDVTTILIPSNAIVGSVSAVAGFAKTFLLQDNDLLTISVVEPTGGGNAQNTVTGVIRAVEVTTPLTPDFDYLALDGAGSGNVLVKNDGGSWAIRSQLSTSLTMVNANLPRRWVDVVYGNGRLVAINNTDRMVLTSLDLGYTWIPSYLPLGFSTTNVQAILYGNGLFVVASFDGQAIAFSSDGINWEMFFNQNNPFLAVSHGCYAQGKFVWASESGHIVILDDALSAVQFVFIAPDDQTPLGWVNIKYGDGRFILIENGVNSIPLFGGAQGSLAAESTDLTSWTYNYLPKYSGWNALTYNKSYNHFYASSYNEQIIARYIPGITLNWEVDGTVTSCPSTLVSNGKSTIANSTINQVFLSSEKPANLNNPLAASWINQTYPMSPGLIYAMTAISSSSGGGGNNGPFTLDITTDGNGTITLSNPGPYYYGDVVLVNATPNSGYLFNTWTGGITSAVNPYSLTVTQNVTAVATFSAPSGQAVSLVRNLHSTVVDSEQLLAVPIEVTVVDGSKNPVAVQVDIQAEIYSGNGILLGTKTVTSQAGVAVFSDLAIQGSGYVTVLFTSPGLNPILSAGILVNNVGTNSQSLRIDTQPSGAVSGSPLTQQPEISTVDINGDIILGSVNAITVSILSGNAVLSGTTTLTATDGFVAFTDLVLTGPSGPVVLQFTSPGITTAISLTFNLVNNGNNLPLSGNFPIRPKSSITSNKAPTTSDLVAYELAVNLVDQKIYMRDGANKVHLVGDVSSGSSTPLLDSLGNVTITNKTTHDLIEWDGTAWVNLQPSGLLGSGTKDFLARWNGSGKLETSGVQDSGTYITTGNASIGRWASNTYAQFAHSGVFSPTASTNYALLQSSAGETFLNSTKALHFRQDNAEVAAFNQGNLLVGYADGDTTTYKVDIKGTLHTTGDTTLDKLAGTGSRMVVANASGTLSTNAIPEGTVTSVALTSDSKELTITGSPVTDAGTIDLALSTTGVTAGSYTHASVTVDASGRITKASSGDTASLKAGTGISISGTYPEFTITNNAPDQVVKLTAGSGISTSGTYPDFTISSTLTQYTDTLARAAISAGTGISYNATTGVVTNASPDQTVLLTAGSGISTSGTYPNFTVTNTSPDQTVTLTAGTGISVTGTYPNFTITNSSTSSGGTVTSVDLSVPTGFKVSGNPVTTSGKLALAFDTGYALPTSSSQTNWDTAYSNRITSLTTTGSSGSATLSSNTLNIPTYTLAGLGGQASSTNLTSLSGLTYTAASFVKMTGAGTFSLDTSNYLTTNQTITLSGDVTGSGTTAITATLATVTATKGGTGQTSYTLGDTLYSSAANTLAKLAGNTTTTKQFLSQTGTGSVSAAPAWSTVSKSDVGLGSVENTALSTWAGSANLTTLGTITSGTWNSSTKIGLAYGGTNASITATNGGVIYSTASALAVSAAGTSGQILKSNGAAAPTWMSTSSITSVGTLNGLAVTETVTTDDTVTITGVASQTGKLLLIKDALANSLFSVDYSGVATSKGLAVNGMTYPGADGSSGQVLSTNGAGTLSWITVTSPAAGASGDIQFNDGAGNITASSNFSYGSSAYDQLAIYSNNAAFGVLGVFGASGQTYPLMEFRDYLGTTVYSYFDATGNLYLNAQADVRFADADSSNYVAIEAPATIATNYTLTLPTTAGTSGYVMTTNGTGTLSWTNATNANTASAIVKRDASGNFTAGTVTASLTGTASKATNLVGGNSTTLLGSLPYQSNTDTTTLLSPNTTSTKKYLAQTGTGSNGAAPAWSQPAVTEISSSTAGGVVYSTASALAVTSAGTSGQVLTSNGSSAPTWSSASVLPSGVIQMYGGSITQSVSAGTLTTTAPSGWALCDGSAISRSIYSALFSAIGTNFGSGDGSTTFNLPDCRGRAVIGSGQSSDVNMTNRTLGTKYGSEGSTIQAAMLPTFSMDNDSTTGNHTHGYTAFSFNTNYPPMVYTGYNTPSTWTWGVAGGTLFSVLHNTAAQTNLNITSSGNHTHSRTNSTPTKVDIVQPSLAMNYIIKT